MRNNKSNSVFTQHHFPPRSGAGFTLIETVIYIALLGIMLGGGMIGVYNILEGSGRTRQAMYREQEGYFITRKINSILSETDTIYEPAPNTSSTVLRVHTPGGDVRIELFGNQVTLQRGLGATTTLNDTLIPAANLSFTENSASSTLVVNFELDSIPYSINHRLP